MNNPLSITVVLPEPASRDVQALAACEQVLTMLSQQKDPGSLPGGFIFKALVVAWLAEKYLDRPVQMIQHQPMNMLTNPCSLSECHNTSFGECGAINCPKRAR